MLNACINQEVLSCPPETISNASQVGGREGEREGGEREGERRESTYKNQKSFLCGESLCISNSCITFSQPQSWYTSHLQQHKPHIFWTCPFLMSALARHIFAAGRVTTACKDSNWIWSLNPANNRRCTQSWKLVNGKQERKFLKKQI